MKRRMSRDPIMRELNRSTVERIARIVGPNSAAERALEAAAQYDHPTYWQDLDNDAIVVIEWSADAKSDRVVPSGKPGQK